MPQVALWVFKRHKIQAPAKVMWLRKRERWWAEDLLGVLNDRRETVLEIISTIDTFERGKLLVKNDASKEI